MLYMPLKNILQRISLFSSFFYPSFCRNCNKFVESNVIFCTHCDENIKPISSMNLSVTGKTQIKIIAVSNYKDPLKSLILKKSFDDLLASKQLGRIILQKTIVSRLPIDFVVPVPLHWSRYAMRGFNQSAVIAKVLSKALKAFYLPCLKRRQRTVFQSTLSGSKRQANVKNAFGITFKESEVLKKLIKGKHVLLVDDLCTTGATLKSAAKILLSFQPLSVVAVVACRVV
jgi:ComF family protein